MSSCFWRNLPSAFSQVELIFPNTLSSQYLLFPMHLTLLNFRFPKDVNTVRKCRIASGWFFCLFFKPQALLSLSFVHSIYHTKVQRILFLFTAHVGTDIMAESWGKNGWKSEEAPVQESSSCGNENWGMTGNSLLYSSRTSNIIVEQLHRTFRIYLYKYDMSLSSRKPGQLQYQKPKSGPYLTQLCSWFLTGCHPLFTFAALTAPCETEFMDIHSILGTKL